MRIVITGATGNVGTSVLEALEGDPEIESIVGVARRRPELEMRRTTFVTADIGSDPLEAIFRGADAVVHLAWQLQPSHRLELLERTNVQGSERVFEAAERAGVRALVYASSVGAYRGGPKERRVDESWPTDGIPSSHYGRQKAKVERMLDTLEEGGTSMRIVRMRPALIFKREAASDIRRLFVGPFVPRALFDRRLLKLMPDHPRLRFQAVHSLDVGEAFRLALHREVRGAFNLAAEPVLDPEVLASLFGAKRVRVTPGLLRRAVSLAWRMRLVAASEGWVDLAFGVPLMECRRAHEELGWTPTRRADQALLELVEGMREGAGLRTPPLAPRRGFGLARPPDPSAARGPILRPSDAKA